MHLNSPAVKGGWRDHPPHDWPDGPTDRAYRLDFGKHRGKRLDECPENYLAWLLDTTDSPALRLLVKRALDVDTVLDDADELQLLPPSPEPAAHVVPRLCFLFEQAVRDEFGQLEMDPAEAFVVNRCLWILRGIVSEYTGREWPAEAVA